MLLVENELDKELAGELGSEAERLSSLSLLLLLLSVIEDEIEDISPVVVTVPNDVQIS